MKLTRKKIRKLIIEQINGLIDIPSITLSISKDLDRCNRNSEIIEDFCKFCAKELSIDEDINVKIVSNREKENIKTTAFYDPDDHRVLIYGKDRAIVDICRSIAHELTHMSQMIQDRIKFPVQDAGGEIEDEANAKAGEIVKLFAKSRDDRLSIYESKKI